MRIACPGCAAEYEVPSLNLKPNRKVRCAQCDAQWVPVGDAAATPPDEAPDTAVQQPMPAAGETAMDRLAATTPRQPSGALRAAWALTVLVLVGSAAAAFTWRSHVTQVWPASAWVLGMVDRVVPAQAQPLRADRQAGRVP
jgi:predicted Zn finger-like uncharacterized protein